MRKYEIVESVIRDEITNGVLKSGEKLPDLQQLCERFDVSHITIQKALANLTKEGFITRIKSKGTFVQGRSKESEGTLGMVISVIEKNDTTLLSTIQGAQREAANQGFTLLLEITDGFEDSERKAITDFVQGGVDGLLLYLNHESIVYSMLGGDDSDRKKVPYVMIDHYEINRPCSSVTVNNTDGGFMATEYLLKHGHTRIAIIYSNLGKNTENDRYTGYCYAMESFGLRAVEEHAYNNNIQSMQRLLEDIQGGGVTAAFAVNDRLALQTLNFLYEKGVRVPDDFSLIGFDDSNEAQYAIVPLTTMRQDFSEVGAQSAKLLKGVLEEGKRGHQYKKMFLPVQLVERNSVKSISTEKRQ